MEDATQQPPPTVSSVLHSLKFDDVAVGQCNFTKVEFDAEKGAGVDLIWSFNYAHQKEHIAIQNHTNL